VSEREKEKGKIEEIEKIYEKKKKS